MRFSFLSLFLILALKLSAQPYLSSFSVQASNSSVIVEWITTADFTCEDLKILHGTDTSKMKAVFTYPGICGIEGKEERYVHIFHESVPNKVNYFQIDMGVYGRSELDSTFVLELVNQPAIIPSPANVQSIVHFTNINRSEVSLSLINSSGLELSSIQTRESKVALSALNPPSSGLFFVVLRINSSVYATRFFYNQ